jgi:hypothetical protein
VKRVPAVVLAGAMKLTTKRVCVLPVLGLTEVLEEDVCAAAAALVRATHAKTRNASRTFLDIDAESTP